MRYERNRKRKQNKGIGLLTVFFLLSFFLVGLSNQPALGEASPEEEKSVPAQERIFQDSKTGLEWMAGPDLDTFWNEAGSWVKGLQKVDNEWRMPELEELRDIFRDSERSRKLLSLFRNPDCWVWARETKGPEHAWIVFPDHSGGGVGWIRRSFSEKGRAFAVRSMP